VVQHETIYVSAGDRTLYALEQNSGRLRWQHQFAGSAQYPASLANDILYITVTGDGVYALRGADGVVLWHQPLGSSPSTPGVTYMFDRPVVLDGAVYLVRFDNRGQGVLFALDAHTGAECWHTPYPLGGARLAVAQ
jgi:outer membrane protein assembly factor BamB